MENEYFGLNQIDRRLKHYLTISHGFFIEVGANDGVSQSNTLHFEKYHNWRGLLIEPIPELANQCKKNRPCCIVENCALVPFSYPDPYIDMDYCNLMSLVKGAQKTREEELEHLQRGCEVQNIESYQLRVPARTLNSILEEHEIETIDFFSLDVEGYELSVLKGLDLERFQPTYLLIEARYRQEIDAYLSPYYETIAELTERDILYKSKKKIQEEESFQLTTPVAFFIFKRPDLTQQVFDAIAKAQPPKLFVIADGPRNSEEAQLCNETRSVIQNIGWNCEVFTNFSEVNMGLKKRISSGLDWVFSLVEEAIILEDDCLPSPSFFQFCQILLERYRDDERVFLISGDNFQFDQSRTPYSYYFSRYTHIWGWACWRRSWKCFDSEMKSWPEFKHSGLLKHILDDSYEQDYWLDILEKTYKGDIDSWAYILQYCCWIQNGLSILPNSNLVSNLGFRQDAVHTTDPNSLVANLPLSHIWDIKHPPFLIRNWDADSFTFDYVFNGKEMKEPIKDLHEQLTDAQKQISAITQSHHSLQIEFSYLKQLRSLQNKLEQLYIENQKLQTKLSNAVIRRNNSQTSLKRSRQVIKREKRRSKRIKKEVEQTKLQLQESLDTIAAMKSSKFWWLRAKWIRFKALFGRDTSKIDVNASIVPSSTESGTIKKPDSSEANDRRQKRMKKRLKKQRQQQRSQVVLSHLDGNQAVSQVTLPVEQRSDVEQALERQQTEQTSSLSTQNEQFPKVGANPSTAITPNPEEILLQSLKEFPRYIPTTINFFGTELSIVDSASFLSMYQDIFKNQIYKFEAENQNPRIIDGGANIGLTVIYFKQLYPDSHIISFEPDEQVFYALKANVEHFGFSNVELVNKALWNSETVLEFMAEGADAGRLVELDSEQKISKVPTTRLRDYLQKPVDFLKIDIEGAETEVLEDCRDLLGNVKNAFVEFHSFADRPQTLHIITDILASAGFRLHVQPVNVSPQPFCHRGEYMGMDLQLNIFAFRN